MIVVDTNVLIHTLLPDPATETAKAVLRRDSDWHAPSIWRSELRNALVLLARADRLPWNDAPLLMEVAERRMARLGHAVPSSAVLEAARRSGCTAYDAEFAVLAERLDVPLVTWDRALLDAFAGRAVTPEDFAGS
ncbi:MAG: type II toxin-antitoxin system VapC family toxin [Gemmatimonadetes bacterium]|nr:type II toxin-antitoxin system VapC family toxin [Gemmatimonadota bacterium]